MDRDAEIDSTEGLVRVIVCVMSEIGIDVETVVWSTVERRGERVRDSGWSGVIASRSWLSNQIKSNYVHSSLLFIFPSHLYPLYCSCPSPSLIFTSLWRCLPLSSWSLSSSPFISYYRVLYSILFTISTPIPLGAQWGRTSGTWRMHKRRTGFLLRSSLCRAGHLQGYPISSTSRNFTFLTYLLLFLFQSHFPSIFSSISSSLSLSRPMVDWKYYNGFPSHWSAWHPPIDPRHPSTLLIHSYVWKPDYSPMNLTYHLISSHLSLDITWMVHTFHFYSTLLYSTQLNSHTAIVDISLPVTYARSGHGPQAMLEANYGMASPHGYRTAMRLMQVCVRVYVCMCVCTSVILCMYVRVSLCLYVYMRMYMSVSVWILEVLQVDKLDMDRHVDVEDPRGKRQQGERIEHIRDEEFVYVSDDNVRSCQFC